MSRIAGIITWPIDAASETEDPEMPPKIMLAITLTMFLSAARVERVLGETGINVITRLLGLLLSALAVQFVLD